MYHETGATKKKLATKGISKTICAKITILSFSLPVCHFQRSDTAIRFMQKRCHLVGHKGGEKVGKKLATIAVFLEQVVQEGKKVPYFLDTKQHRF